MPTLLVVSAFGMLGLMGLFPRGAPVIDAAPASLALVVCVYCLAQAIPLPVGLVEALSPEHAEIYHRALDPFSDRLVTASLTFDRGATLAEGLKWGLYAVTFLLAGNVTKRSGRRRVCLQIFASGTALAAVTLLHGIFNAERVFDFYEPTVGKVHWALSPLVNPNNLAGYLNLASFTGLGLLLTERSQDVRRLMVVGLVLTVAQSILSGSRGGALALVLGAGMVWVTLSRFVRLRLDPTLTRRARTWVLVTFAASLITTVVAGPSEVWSELQQTGTEKLVLSKWTMELIPDFPWFGVGASSFEAVIPRYSDQGMNLVFTNPENLPLAWLSEFGLPVGILALGGYAWLLRGHAVGVRSSVISACSFVGVLVVLLQNFADLAFVVPGFVVAFCALVSCLRNHEGEPRASLSSSWRHYSLWMATGVCAVAWTAAAMGSHPTAESDRRALHRRLDASDFSSLSAKTRFFQELKEAMGRHPADPYLRRLGTTAAYRSQDGSAIDWAAATLSLSPKDGRTHLLLAHILARRGVLHQALLQLRLAVTHAPDLERAVATAALAWTHDVDQLERIVPPGVDGVGLLVRLGQGLVDESRWDSSVHLLEEALARDPRASAAHATLVTRLLTQASGQKEPCRGLGRSSCLRRIERSLEVLKTETRGDASVVRQRARYLSLEGRVDEALTLLNEECPPSSPLCIRESISLSNEVGRSIEPAARTLVALTCDDPVQCERTHTWLGRLYRDRGEPGTALKHYWSAAEHARTPEAWLLAAREAYGMGSLTRAMLAVENARRLPVRDSKLREQIDGLREEISRKKRSLIAPR